MATSNPATAADLERLKRELTQRINHVEQHATRTASTGNSSQNNAMTALTRRVDQLEQRLQRTIEQVNTTLTNARQFDDRLGGRIDALERRITELGRSR